MDTSDILEMLEYAKAERLHVKAPNGYVDYPILPEARRLTVGLKIRNKLSAGVGRWLKHRLYKRSTRGALAGKLREILQDVYHYGFDERLVKRHLKEVGKLCR